MRTGWCAAPTFCFLSFFGCFVRQTFVCAISMLLIHLSLTFSFPELAKYAIYWQMFNLAIWTLSGCTGCNKPAANIGQCIADRLLLFNDAACNYIHTIRPTFNSYIHDALHTSIQ